VIVSVAGIVLNSFLEILDGLLLATSRGVHSEVVVHLGKRQARRNKLESAFGLREVSVRVSG